MCGETFGAANDLSNGKSWRWCYRARAHHKIVEHARTHGVVGYAPTRNRDKTRLDWVRSPGETSEFRADARIAPKNRKNTTFCAGCARWKQTTQFRRGASTCNTCLKITCAACGRNRKQRWYRTQDVYNFLKRKINALCRTCRKKGKKPRGSEHKTHRG